MKNGSEIKLTNDNVYLIDISFLGSSVQSSVYLVPLSMCFEKTKYMFLKTWVQQLLFKALSRPTKTPVLTVHFAIIVIVFVHGLNLMKGIESANDYRIIKPSYIFFFLSKRYFSYA